MTIPLPPGAKPLSTRIPKPETKTEMTKTVERDSVSFIMDLTLSDYHRTDPNVVGFIIAFLKCRDVKQAAHSVGLTKPQGDTLRRRRDIHECICKVTDEALMKHGFDASEIVERVKEIASVDIGDFEKPDGSYIESLLELAPEVRRAVRKFKVRNEYGKDPNGMRVVVGKLIEVELWDKLKSIELLGREKDTFKETKVHKHDITTNMSQILLQSRDIAEEHIESLKDVSSSVPAIAQRVEDKE